MPSKVLIIGAGAVGAATALSLAERGYHVTVIDQAKTVASGASAANGAQLSYSYTDTLASPETFKNLPKLITGMDHAFRFSPDVDRDLINWAIRFIRECARSRSDENTLRVLEIALRSQAIMLKWLEEYQFDINHRQAGKFHLYESRNYLIKAKERVLLKNRLGVNQKILMRDEVFDAEPALRDMGGDLAGAVYSPIDEVGDAAIFTKKALNKAIEISGGQLHLGVALIDFIKDGSNCRAVITSDGLIEADIVIVCAGFHTKHLVYKLGTSLPILPVAGYSLTYPATDKSPEISVTDTSNKIVVCRIGDKVRIAGMADMGLVTQEPPVDRIQTLMKTVQSRFPLAADYSGDGQPWVGIRPMTPDSRPIVRKCGGNNVFVNSGHGMLGWTLAAGTADLLMDQLREEGA